MAIRSTSQMSGPTKHGSYADEERGSGWVPFAGVLLLYLGILNIIEGVALASNAHFSVTHAHAMFGNLSPWGWVALAVGVSEVLVGIGVFARDQLAHWVGVIILGVNAITQVLMIPAYPVWSLAVFALDVLAIYGLITYGQSIASAS
jgi:hypothetical protein